VPKTDKLKTIGQQLADQETSGGDLDQVAHTFAV
jgi:hypothetical protein